MCINMPTYKENFNKLLEKTPSRQFMNELLKKVAK